MLKMDHLNKYVCVCACAGWFVNAKCLFYHFSKFLLIVLISVYVNVDVDEIMNEQTNGKHHDF